MTAAPPEPVSVPVREVGYAYAGSSSSWWEDLTNDPTPELRWPYAVEVFDRMRKQDAQVSSVLRAVSAPILRTAWAVDQGAASDEVTQFVATCLGLPIHGQPGDDVLRGRDRFSFNTHLRLALLILPFGHSFFEQVYRIDEQGQARLRKLAPRLPRTIRKINVARDGGLISIEQHKNITAVSSTSGPVIPVRRLVAYTLEREGGNWLGTSLLRSAYKFWILKDRALRTWSQHVDRNGMGVATYEAAEGETNLGAGRKLATGIRSGAEAGGAIPHGAKLNLQGVQGDTPDISAFVRYCDEQIARAVLAHFLNLGTQTGSWALGSTFADFFTLSLQAIAEEVRDTATSHIVEDLVDVNFGLDVPAPRLTFDEIGSRTGVQNELDLIRRAAGLEDDDALAEYLRTHTTVPAEGNPK